MASGGKYNMTVQGDVKIVEKVEHVSFTGQSGIFVEHYNAEKNRSSSFEEIREILRSLGKTDLEETHSRLWEEVRTTCGDLLKFQNIIKSVGTVINNTTTEAGTFFIARWDNRLVFFTAGHCIFGRSRTNVTRETLGEYTIVFGNLDGDLTKRKPYEALTDTTVANNQNLINLPINLLNFLDRFEDCRGMIEFGGKQFILRRNQEPEGNQAPPPRDSDNDFCAIELVDENIDEKFKQYGLSFLEVGVGDYLNPNANQRLTVFGHPDIRSSDRKRPLTPTWGNEVVVADSETSKHIVFDNDTLGGMSGSPILGRDPIMVKAIHILGGPGKENRGQKLHNLSNWINV